MTRRRQPEQRRGTPKPLFVVRSGNRQPPPSKPEAPAFQAQSFGQLQFQKHAGRADTRPGHERFRHEVDPGVLDRRRCAPKLVRVPCRSSSCTTAVEPVAAEERPLTKTMASRGRRPPPEGSKTLEERPLTKTMVSRGTSPPLEGSGTPVAPPMTPMRPVWQRRILMGMRCELPRFSGLILYDEHGRRIRGSTPVEKEDFEGCYNTQGPPIVACQKQEMYKEDYQQNGPLAQTLYLHNHNSYNNDNP
uniref:Uncharacterized protein n=1 Tax=Leersia perrieri TaxID=77586 RepID=A0A0D9VFH7_9ORYZ